MKMILFVLALFFTSFSFGQKTQPIHKKQLQVFPPNINSKSTYGKFETENASKIYKPLFFSVNCDPIPPPFNGCNYLKNNNFRPTQDYNCNTHSGDPFSLNLIPDWHTASGTPTIYDGCVYNYPFPPSGTTGYFFGAAANDMVPVNYESIVQKIPNLIPGHNYVLSFFKAKKDLSAAVPPQLGPLDGLEIRFINCSDYNATFTPNSSVYPPVPANNQQVYCETVIDHLDFQQVLVRFTATQAFNMIWIATKDGQTPGTWQGMHFGYPELIDISPSVLQSQVIQATQPNCMATLPNCGPLNSLFTWEGPNSIHSAPVGVPIQIDVTNSSNIGTWNLTLTIPTAVITNSNCSPQGFGLGSVEITSFCQPIPPCINTISCNSISLTGCNYSTNGDFIQSSTYDPLNPLHVDMPFRMGFVPNWVETNGTPQIYDNIASPLTVPPPTVSGYSYLFSTGAGFGGNTTVSSGDGIAQKIPALTVNNSYAMTFFKKLVSGISTTPIDMDKFYVVLMHCSDYNLIRTCDNTIADFPINSQIVYCESNMNNTSWEQVFFCFMANDNYDMIWIFPKQNPNVLFDNGAGTAGVDFTGLEFINTTNFSAGPQNVAPVYPNCTVTIGPSTPNCGVRNALFEWLMPGGGITPAPPNQQIQVTASATTWHTYALQMTVPTAIEVILNCGNGCTDCISVKNATNTNLGGNCYLSAYVSVQSCPPPDIRTGSWVWINGDNIPDQYGIYGIKGQESPLNKPGARAKSAYGTDPSGTTLWFFGGSGYAENTYDHLNDLWSYNTTNDQWTWRSGDKIAGQSTVYGTRLVESPLNKPGARWESVMWVDKLTGNLWLFGGNGFQANGQQGYFNDMWKFDVQTGNWTWMNGNNIRNQNGVYGSKGVPSPFNTPGARANAMTWTDHEGKFWLYSGLKFNNDPQFPAIIGGVADLWKFDPITNEWTWENGDDLLTQTPLYYGTKGVSSPLNFPGFRNGKQSWTDEVNKSLYLFGSNDVWKYDLISKEWTWVSGSNTPVRFGIYGTKGVASASNTPGARSTSVSWKDKQGNFWLYGGNGYGENSLGALSDFWKLDLVSFEWTWVTGSKNTQQFANHGIKGVNAITNDPGSKGSASSWIDVSGQLWLFGGGFNGLANDLWRYNDGCLGPTCFAGKSNNSSGFVSNSLISNSANTRTQTSKVNNPLNVKTEMTKSVVSNIQSLEIFNTAGQLLKKVNSALESYDVLRQSKVAGLIPGLYFIKVFYKDKTYKTIRHFLQ